MNEAKTCTGARSKYNDVSVSTQMRGPHRTQSHIITHTSKNNHSIPKTHNTTNDTNPVTDVDWKQVQR